MWSKKKTMAFSNNHTLISRSSRIVGDLHFSGDLQIEGKVCGNVIVESGEDAKVVVAESGVVEGEIRVPIAVINGHVVGDIHSSKHIELAAKAVVVGSVHYQLIEMVKGSQVNGNLIYSGSSTAPEKNSATIEKSSTSSVVTSASTPSLGVVARD
jgi:cytoskeletal protein CcmA (bactofilin family)